MDEHSDGVTSPITRLVAELRDEAEDLESLQARVPAYVLLRRVADRVEQAKAEHDNQPLPVSVVARLWGYSEDHLRTMVREGKLPDAREEAKQGSRILIPRFAAPRKPLAERTTTTTSSPPPSEEDSLGESSDCGGETRVGRALEQVAEG